MTHRRTFTRSAQPNTREAPRRWAVFLSSVVLAVALMSAAVAAGAQSTIILAGRVSAANDAPVSAARVTLTNTETAEVRTSGTATNGSYVVVGLNPGKYEVRVNKVGFAPAVRQIELLVGQRGTLDFNLQESAVQLEGVRVTAASTSNFEVQRTDVSTAVVNSEIEHLPLNTRNTLNLAAIVPGIKTFAPTAGRAIPAAGALPDLRFWNFYLDGVEWKSMFNGNLVGIPQTGSPLPQESLREFRVYLNPYDAEFTRGGSYIMSAVTQRGTNDQAGSAFLYFQNNSLRAYDEFQRRNKRNSIDRVDYSRMQFGFNNRGPIVKDKFFYAISYEQNKIDDAITVTPTNPGVFNQYRGDRPAPTQNHNGVIRLTAPMGDKNTFDAIYAGRYYNSETNFGGRVSREGGIKAKYWVHSAQLRNTYTPTSSMVNQFSLHALIWDHNESPLVPGPTRSYPSIVTGTNTFPLLLKEKHYRLTDKFTWTPAGSQHVVEAGGQLERVNTSSFLPSNKDGFFEYTTDASALPFRGTIAVGVNDQNGTSDALASSNGWVTGVFVQDRWQVTNSFNLNLGLRYDAELNTLVNDFITPWAQDTTLRRVLDSKFLQGKRKNDLNNVAPRVSFSWDVTGKQQTFLRGGWGLMYGRVPSTYPFAEKQASVWRSYTFTFNANPGNTATDDPAVLRQRVIAGGAAITPNLSLVSREIKTPYTKMASVGIGHQFTGAFAMNLDYVDQRSSNLYVNTQVNALYAGQRKLTNRFGNITLWDSFGKAQFQALTAGATYDKTTDESMPLRTSLAYTLASYKSTFENFGAWVNPSYFTMQPSSGDERHRLVLSGMTPLPFGFEFSAVAIVASPSRFVSTFGQDTNHTGIFNDDFVTPNERAIRPSGGWSTWYKTVDLRFEKMLPAPRGSATLSIEVFNLFNTVNWSGYGGARTNTTGTVQLANYGQPTGAYAPRQLQAGIRYKF
jgi:hypothetical protein